MEDVWALLFFAVIGAMLAADFGIAKVITEGGFAIICAITAVAGYVLAWVKTYHHAMQHCERCKKNIAARSRARQLRSPRWWGTFAICEACAQHVDFICSFPNREYAYENEMRAARWRKMGALFLFVVIGALVAEFVLDASVGRVVVTLLLGSALVAHGIASTRRDYYQCSFCACCARDFEKYEWRQRSIDHASAVICERCADEAGDDDGEMSYN